MSELCNNAPLQQDFPLRPVPVDRETVPSFLSRLAAMRRTPIVEYAQNMGAPLRHILDGDYGALSSLAYWGGLSSVELETLTSWTGEPIGEVRMRFRGEVFVSRALRNPVMRGCPICLREDSQHHTGESVEAMAMRGDWQFREVTLCLRHNHLLVPLWKADNRYERYDFASRLREVEGDLLSGALDVPQCLPSQYDIWLDHRLGTGEDPTWLAKHGLHPATTFCRLLGVELLRLRNTAVPDQVLHQRVVQAVGFSIVMDGEVATRDALQTLADAADGPGQSPNGAFGNLFAQLDQLHQDDRAFEPFRRFLRDCILVNWPIAAGEMILGEVQPQRRLHSLYTAARQLATTEALLEPFLVEAGALTADDPRFADRKVFDAQAHADLLAEIPTLVSRATLQREIGASRAEVEALVAVGILVPKLQNEIVRLRWSIAQAQSVLGNVLAKAVPIAGAEPGWESFLAAKKRTSHPLGALLDAARSGAITLGRVEGSGFSGLRLRREEVTGLDLGSPQDEAAKLIPAMAFGISVEIKDKGRFKALAVGGHTPATRKRHERTGVENLYMSTDDIAAFHRRFVTISTLAAESGRTIPEVRAALKRAGVSAFAPGGQDFGRIFLRKDAEWALSRKS